MMPFIYLFGLRLTGKTRYACLAAVLLGTDFMHFTLSRIATIDIIVAFFILGMFYFMYAFVVSEKRRYLLLAGLFTGLGCATKWTGIYALCGLFVVFSSLDDRKDQKDRCKEEKQGVTGPGSACSVSAVLYFCLSQFIRCLIFRLSASIRIRICCSMYFPMES